MFKNINLIKLSSYPNLKTHSLGHLLSQKTRSLNQPNITTLLIAKFSKQKFMDLY